MIKTRKIKEQKTKEKAQISTVDTSFNVIQTCLTIR